MNGETALRRGRQPRRRPSASAAPLPSETEIAIVGAGIMGLAIAYNLASRGLTNVVVVDAHYLAWGASGRNGGGVRQQWSTEMNIRLMQESVEICAGFAQELGTNVWMRQGGYLFLARTEGELARMEKNIALQNRCGVPTRLVSLAEAQAIVPEMDTGPFAGACFNPTDGIVFPWPFLWGYARAAVDAGVGIHTQTPVTAIERRERDFLLHTSKGTLRADRVVCAAGAWSPAFARMLGLELPNWPHRHEIMSSEPLKPFLRPMVSVLDSGLYFSQSLRGEVVGGITLHDPAPDHEVRMGSRLRFVEEMARGMIEVIPRLGDVKVVRQWAGPYDLTEDGNPIVGEAPGLPGFFLCCGFMGHGFMMAPVVGRYYALHLLGRETHPFFRKWRLARFAEGDLEKEDMIIG